MANVDTFIANIAVKEARNGSGNITHGDNVNIFWLFLLTWSGYDTTSGIYGMGKIPSAYRCKGVIECK